MANHQSTSLPIVNSDGFLTRMFGRRDAEFFIESLLKVDARNVHLVGNVLGWPNAMMTQIPSTPDARVDTLAPNNQPLYLLDFIPPPIYHVVPQKIWTPPNQSDWRRYVEQVSLRMPVFFIQNDGTVGLPLERALRGDRAAMRFADMAAPLEGGHSTQIRIAFASAIATQETSGHWRVGLGGITRNNVIIIGAVQVSAGGWMPILSIYNA